MLKSCNTNDTMNVDYDSDMPPVPPDAEIPGHCSVNQGDELQMGDSDMPPVPPDAEIPGSCSVNPSNEPQLDELGLPPVPPKAEIPSWYSQNIGHVQHVYAPGLPPVLPKPEIPGWFSYSGRYTRAQFWGKYLAVVIPVSFVSTILSFAYMDFSDLEKMVINDSVPLIEYPPEFYVWMTLLSGVSFVISFPLVVKRFHDVNVSAWVPFAITVIVLIVSYAQLLAASDPSLMKNAIFQLINIVCSVIMLVFLVKDSTIGTNAYGPSYKYPDGR